MSLHPFESSLAAIWPPDQWRDLTIVAAVSGGADSVAMLRALAALKTGGAGRLCAAHFNHKLRIEADNDEQFVVALCQDLGLSCKTGAGRVAQLAADTGEGIEPAARRARYEFLKQTAGRLGARFVLTAHTADDQAETILHRIIRGTGIAGLSGMARSRRLGHATLLRPLLTVRRSELEMYLRDIGQPFREDSSNADRRFTRNRIRHELLPLLARHYNSTVADALLRLGALAAEAQGIIDELTDRLLDRAVKLENNSVVRIDASELSDQPPYMLRELLAMVWQRQSWPLQAMGFQQWNQLAGMILTSNATRHPLTAVNKKIFPGNIQAEFHNGLLQLMQSK
jgi:tRNA(Ile)-lysidine synthase